MYLCEDNSGHLSDMVTVRPSLDDRAERIVAQATVLVVDDDSAIRAALGARLRDYDVIEAGDCASALRGFGEGVDVVLLDYRLPDGDGLSTLRQLKRLDPDVPVIMLTAHSSIDQAVEAMQAGAYYYASKPVSVETVALIVERALAATAIRRELRTLRQELGDANALIGECAAMHDVKELLARIAVSQTSTVLITGESGTGKDLAARAIHDASVRASGPFLDVTCSALAPTLLESELFGHEAGAFTDAHTRRKGLFETAHTGTLFVDEIGDIGQSVQIKLLRFVEERRLRRVGGTTDIRADVRVIAATNIDLQRAVRRRAFREDLYYRLAVITVEMPPLRERGDDIILLAHYFVDRFNREFNRHVRGLSRRAMATLKGYRWPGNVRELRNCVERAVLLSTRELLDQSDFKALTTMADNEAVFQLPPTGVDLGELERSLVVQALDRCAGNRTRAGQLLGLNRDQVRYRVKTLGL